MSQPSAPHSKETWRCSLSAETGVCLRECLPRGRRRPWLAAGSALLISSKCSRLFENMDSCLGVKSSMSQSEPGIVRSGGAEPPQRSCARFKTWQCSSANFSSTSCRSSSDIWPSVSEPGSAASPSARSSFSLRSRRRLASAASCSSSSRSACWASISARCMASSMRACRRKRATSRFNDRFSCLRMSRSAVTESKFVLSRKHGQSAKALAGRSDGLFGNLLGGTQSMSGTLLVRGGRLRAQLTGLLLPLLLPTLLGDT
mmetsp:Transcript_132413/g.423796  ORF Transcript_132413/g.423796 Transcript_132413/m.423796 type:complete len:259 (+) Transcript_132413:129-905(+)